MPWKRTLAAASCLVPMVAAAGEQPGHCVTQPSCQVPVYAPPCQPTTATATAAGVAAPAGMFAQPPATGEVQGESTGYGIRGLQIRIPELNLQLPTVQLPSTFKYRRGPQMHIDAAAASYVTGPAANFGMLATPAGVAPVGAMGAPASGAGAPAAYPSSMPPTPYNYQCVPPHAPPCDNHGALIERRLIEELIRKENELREVNERFQHLESLVSQLAQQRASGAAPASSVQPSSYERPGLLPRETTADQPGPSVYRAVSSHANERPVTRRSNESEFGAWSRAEQKLPSKAEVIGFELRDPFQ